MPLELKLWLVWSRACGLTRIEKNVKDLAANIQGYLELHTMNLNFLAVPLLQVQFTSI